MAFRRVYLKGSGPVSPLSNSPYICGIRSSVLTNTWGLCTIPLRTGEGTSMEVVFLNDERAGLYTLETVEPRAGSRVH